VRDVKGIIIIKFNIISLRKKVMSNIAHRKFVKSIEVKLYKKRGRNTKAGVSERNARKRSFTPPRRPSRFAPTRRGRLVRRCGSTTEAYTCVLPRVHR